MFFKTYDNVPDMYVEDSRDFQYISGAYDLIFNYVLNNAVKIISLKSIDRIDASMVSLLCDYLGFSNESNLTINELRYILSNFPTAIKNKGNLEGLKLLISSLYLSNSSVNNLDIEIPSTFYDSGDINAYTLSIIADNVQPDKLKINNILKYVKPIGVKVDNVYKFKNEYAASITPDAYLSDKTQDIEYVNEENSSVYHVAKTPTISTNFEETTQARVGATRVYIAQENQQEEQQTNGE